jgi:hypothetical protein
MLTIYEFNQIKASLKIMGGKMINDEHHVPETNVIYLLQEFVDIRSTIETLSIPCEETTE